MDENSVCDDLSSNIYQTRAATGGLINGNLPLVCGGYGNFNNQCFIIGTNQSIQLNQYREDSSSIVINNKVKNTLIKTSDEVE